MNNQNKSFIYGIGGIVVGVILTTVFSPMMRSDYGGMMSWINNQGIIPKSMGRNLIDRHFIEQMIPHHEGAIAMANLALEKAKTPEVRTLAQAIKNAQEVENIQMKNWYQNWFGQEVPEGNIGNFRMGGMMSQSGMHMGSSNDLETLANAENFDKEFIEQMVPHHQMAIMMAQMLESGTERPEMQELAKNIIKSQSEEIEQMRAWYTKWYK